MSARIAVILVDRANLGRLLPVMEALDAHDQFDQQVICGGSMLLPRFGAAVESLPFPIAGRVWCEVEGSPAHSVGASAGGFSSELQRLQPDYVVIIGDRYEALGAAIAAACLRIPIIHFQGGEISGCLDDTWRRMITQAAAYHVPATTRAQGEITNMVDGTPRIFLGRGCPSSDLAEQVFNEQFAGWPFPSDGPLLVCYHPDTAEDADYDAEMQAILKAVTGYDVEVMWPNIDDGRESIAHAIRHWKKTHDLKTITNLEPRDYLKKLARTRCCVGNSSSFIRDAGFFGTPVVNVGTRQHGRERSHNVKDCEPTYADISGAIAEQIAHGRYSRSDLYGDGKVTERFMAALEELCGVLCTA